MTSLLKWTAPTTFSSGNLADATAMASRASGYYNICQVGGANVTIDNTANLNLFMDIQVDLGSFTPVVGDSIVLYLLPSEDGTNFASGSGTYLPTPDYWIASLQASTDTVAQAKKLVARAIIMPPLKFQILWQCKLTNGTAATANAMSYVTYSQDLNG